MTRKKKPKTLRINQGKYPHLELRRIEKLKIHKDHYLQLLKEDLLSNESQKLVYFQLQKLLKQIKILETRNQRKIVTKKQ